ncbi:hypothetical protein HB364_14825 [Pseudoflavitalea sp. X16]|uniref:hypothetical protein n=1 Tax=Paraflavitalea devenefica TaxID=2716334 RepID=UPI00142028D8|nr:hypothetical protein [Paraflavitalea devenefica]NII26362.1 hypothetical protein [Paraflavitalea devenefica]
MPTRKKKSSAAKTTPATVTLAQQQFHESMEDFFDNYHLDEVEEQLWNWLEAGLGGEHSNYARARDRSNLIFFYKILSRLLKSSWYLHKAQLPDNSVKQLIKQKK